MNIIEIAVDELIPYENNPRNNEKAVDAVAASIKEFRFRQPIVIDANNVIICGHTRLLAAKKLKMKTVPCVMADDLTEEQIRAYRLADNKVAELAGWNDGLLSFEMSCIHEVDMSAFGFEMPQDAEQCEAVEDDYDEEPPAVPKSKLCDIYQLGDHRLMCGDSTNLDDVKKLMNGELADMLLTDPPYNVAYEGKTKDKLKIQNDSMEDTQFREFLRSAFSTAYDVMKAGAVFYIWHADSEGYNFRGACHDVGLNVREVLIWNKNSMVLGRQDYQWKHEPCLYGWKDGASHLWASDRKQTTVIDFKRPSKADIHPTMKPVGLFDYQIKNNTKGGDIVLDLFDGSGTTIMACQQNGRKAYCMELDPRYVDAAIDRWEKFTGKRAVLLSEASD
jgi:site-specific DNA-methyltransferase (adenine-specific)